MSDYIGVLTTKGQQKVAASIGGAALNLTNVRVGDGNGAAITPAPGMIDLVRRVGAAYPIVASGRDPVNATHWRVTALIPVGDGPFDIREIGVFDAAGDMIAIARHVLVEKRSPAQGAAVELTTDIVFPVSDTAQVVVQIDPAAAVSIYQMLRPGFMSVESASLSAPPANPSVGATYVVGVAATGAWVGLTNRLAQWTGLIWTAVDAPQGFLVVTMDKAANDPARWLRRTVAGWASAAAAADAYGVARLASAEDIANAVAGPFVDAANLHASNTAMAQFVAASIQQTRLAIEAEIPAPPNLAPYLLVVDQRAASRGVVVEANQYKGVVATPAILGVSRELTTAERVAGALGANPDTANPYLGLEAYAAIKARLDTIDSNRPTILDYTITAGVSSWLSGDISAYRRVDVVIDNVKASWGGTKTSTAWVNLDFAESPTINAGVVPEICDLRTYYADPSSVTNWVQYGGVAFSLNKGFYSLNGDAGANRWALSGAMWNWGGTAGIAGVLPTVGTKLRLRTINTAASWAATGTLSSGRIRLYCWV